MRASITAEFRRLLRGRIFGATFRTADGRLRTGCFRLDVRKGLTGAGLGYDADDAGNLIVFDMRKRAYRTIKLERVESLRVRGVEVKP